MELLLDSIVAITQAEETLKLSQPTPILETFISESKEKIVNLKRNHAETTRLESFAYAELAVLVERFDYVKGESTRIADRMTTYDAILEDSECTIESKEDLIARAKTILASHQENGNDETHLNHGSKRQNQSQNQPWPIPIRF